MTKLKIGEKYIYGEGCIVEFVGYEIGSRLPCVRDNNGNVFETVEILKSIPEIGKKYWFLGEVTEIDEDPSDVPYTVDFGDHDPNYLPVNVKFKAMEEEEK